MNRLLVVLVAGAALALSGCAADPGTGGPSDSTPTATASPTPTPVPDLVAELVLSIDTVQVLDEAGDVTLEAPFATWSDDLLTLLIDELGEPVVSEYATTPHEWGGTLYAWDGLRIANEHADVGERLIVGLRPGLPEGLTGRTAGGVTLDTAYAELVALAIIPPDEFTAEATDVSVFRIEGERLDPSIDPCMEQAVPAIGVTYDRTADAVLEIAAPTSTCTL